MIVSFMYSVNNTVISGLFLQQNQVPVGHSGIKKDEPLNSPTDGVGFKSATMFLKILR